MLKSIICTYPDFRTLPKGLKQMLVISENLFFSETQASCAQADNRGKSQLWPMPQQSFFHPSILKAA
jgi:hypothetical protein